MKSQAGSLLLLLSSPPPLILEHSVEESGGWAGLGWAKFGSVPCATFPLSISESTHREGLAEQGRHKRSLLCLVTAGQAGRHGTCWCCLGLAISSLCVWRNSSLGYQVFLKEALEQKLEKAREEELRKAATIVRAHVLGYMARSVPELLPQPCWNALCLPGLCPLAAAAALSWAFPALASPAPSQNS